MTIEPPLTPEDMAALFGVPRSKVMEWNRRYDWPHVRIGRRIRWTPEQVAQIQQQHTVTHDADGPTLQSADGRTQRSAARGKKAS